MKLGNRNLDHLVYCVPNLEQSMQEFSDTIGVIPVIGGRHLTKGTKNALFKLGERCYFEILAIDEDNSEVAMPRWMGIDLISKPKLTRWAISSEDIIADQKLIKAFNPQLAQMEEGQRRLLDDGLLKWNMLLPQAEPLVELVPFVIDWSSSPYHPAERLSESQAAILSITFTHSREDNQLQALLGKLLGQIDIELGPVTEISVVIEGPRGSMMLN